MLYILLQITYMAAITIVAPTGEDYQIPATDMSQMINEYIETFPGMTVVKLSEPEHVDHGDKEQNQLHCAVVNGRPAHSIVIPMIREFLNIHTNMSETEKENILDEIFKMFPDCKYPIPKKSEEISDEDATKPVPFFIGSLFDFYTKNPHLHGDKFPHKPDFEMMNKYFDGVPIEDYHKILRCVEFFGIEPLTSLIWKYCAFKLDNSPDHITTAEQMFHLKRKETK